MCVLQDGRRMKGEEVANARQIVDRDIVVDENIDGPENSGYTMQLIYVKHVTYNLIYFLVIIYHMYLELNIKIYIIYTSMCF